MELKKILKGLDSYKVNGNQDISIESIESKPECVRKGSLYVVENEKDDSKSIKDAISNGSNAILIDVNFNLNDIKIPKDITIILVKDLYKTLVTLSINLYGDSSKTLNIIGVTGSKGKTTTIELMRPLLKENEKEVGIISKELIDDDFGVVTLYKTLHDMINKNIKYVLIEVPYDSIKRNIFSKINFSIGVFLNLNIGNEKYLKDIEEFLERCRTSFINADDINAYALINNNKSSNIKTFGIDNFCDLLAKDITVMATSIDFKVKLDNKNERIKLNMPGRFNIYNALAAISIAKALNLKLVKEILAKACIVGRCEVIVNDKDLAIIRDFSSDAKDILNILEMLKTYTKGRVICVYDAQKTFNQEESIELGNVLLKNADYVILTSSINLKKEVDDIFKPLKDTKNAKIIMDTKESYKKAILMMNRKDVLVLLGKADDFKDNDDNDKKELNEILNLERRK